MKYYCTRCKGRITTHRWVYNGETYCGASCQRGGKSQFEKLRKALDKMFKESQNPSVRFGAS